MIDAILDTVAKLEEQHGGTQLNRNLLHTIAGCARTLEWEVDPVAAERRMEAARKTPRPVVKG